MATSPTDARTAGPRALDRFPDPPGGSPEDLNIVLRVVARRTESPDCESLVFARPRGLAYQAGDWVDLRFPQAELAVGRTFSYSSAPGDSDVMITYRRGITPFKRALDAAAPGDVLLITQHGSNGFLRRPRTPAVFIAGGVGVAPFRSMIRDAVDHRDTAGVTLIHVNRTREAPFGPEMAELAGRASWLTVHHVATAEDGRLDARRAGRLMPDLTASRARVYVAGPPAMVESTQRLLAALGVPQDRVLSDSFTGY
ncbi:MAG TPA: FAD-dependent oxidoreductase [Candidatus Limnocylindrales bacterium]|nr:FAD-dependent oxidoreductase [Candidatus Limnocylindrales bacterium]